MTKLSRRSLAWVSAFWCGIGLQAQDERSLKAASVLHVVAIQWREDATEAGKEAVLGGIDAMARKIPGIVRVWTHTLRSQPPEFTFSFAIEFENQAAANVYAVHPVHEEWAMMLEKVRERSYSYQISNRP